MGGAGCCRDADDIVIAGEPLRKEQLRHGGYVRVVTPLGGNGDVVLTLEPLL